MGMLYVVLGNFNEGQAKLPKVMMIDILKVQTRTRRDSHSKGRKLPKHTLEGSKVNEGVVVLRNIDKGQAKLPEAMMIDI